MKKYVILTITLFTMLIFVPTVFALEQSEEITVTIDGLKENFDVPPIIKNGRTLVPFRALAESLNIKVEWDDEKQIITATKENHVVQLQIGNTQAFINQISTELDVPPVILNGRTLVPLRFFGEAFSCIVNWDNEARKISIFSPPKEMNVIGFYALGDRNTSSWTNLFQENYPETSTGNTDVVKEVALGWYSIDKEGNLLTKSSTGWQRPSSWEDVLVATRKYGLETEMVIHVTNSDATISELISNEKAINNAVNNIFQEAKLYGGVNLDFEGLGLKGSLEYLASVRNQFTNFVQILNSKLKQEDINLTLTLHAPNSAYKGYDYQALGRIADKIIIMAYDYGPKPEPIHLVRQAVERSLDFVPAEKLVLGISLPSETAESVLTKVGLAKRYNLQGIALWRLGLITEDVWNGLRTSIK